jgi:hypothetical protein
VRMFVCRNLVSLVHQDPAFCDGLAQAINVSATCADDVASILLLCCDPGVCQPAAINEALALLTALLHPRVQCSLGQSTQLWDILLAHFFEPRLLQEMSPLHENKMGTDCSETTNIRPIPASQSWELSWLVAAWQLLEVRSMRRDRPQLARDVAVSAAIAVAKVMQTFPWTEAQTIAIWYVAQSAS